MAATCTFTTNERLRAAVVEWAAGFTTGLDSHDNSLIDCQAGGVNAWIVTDMTDMHSIFEGSSLFNEDINGWDVSKVTNMNRMFHVRHARLLPTTHRHRALTSRDKPLAVQGATSFDKPLSNWSTARVTSMDSMFEQASVFNQNLSSWNTSSVTTMKHIFKEAQAFNSSLSGWDMSSVTVMLDVFRGAATFNQPLPWDVSKVGEMQHMFDHAMSFNQPLSWDTSRVFDMRYMFSCPDVYALGGVSLEPAFNRPLTFNTSAVGNMEHMFNVRLPLTRATRTPGLLRRPPTSPESPRSSQGQKHFDQSLDGWDVSLVTDMAGMFSGAARFNRPLPWDTSKVTRMIEMFQAAVEFNQDINQWDTSRVTIMEGMFKGAVRFDKPLNHWNVSKVNSMNSMFAGNTEPVTTFNQPLSDWDVSAVDEMNEMFHFAAHFNQPLPWKVSGVKKMQLMFMSATRFNQPLGRLLAPPVPAHPITSHATPSHHPVPPVATPLSGRRLTWSLPVADWDVSNVEGDGLMQMFHYAHEFNSPLIGWDTSKVASLHKTFAEAAKFNQPLPWNVSAVGDMCARARRDDVACACECSPACGAMCVAGRACSRSWSLKAALLSSTRISARGTSRRSRSSRTPSMVKTPSPAASQR